MTVVNNGKQNIDPISDSLNSMPMATMPIAAPTLALAMPLDPARVLSSGVPKEANKRISGTASD